MLRQEGPELEGLGERCGSRGGSRTTVVYRDVGYGGGSARLDPGALLLSQAKARLLRAELWDAGGGKASERVWPPSPQA